MLAWIDATQPGSGERLYGMTVLERLVRTCADAGIDEAVIVSRPGVDVGSTFRADLRPRYEIIVHQREWPENPLRHLVNCLREADDKVVALEGNTVCDSRILGGLISSGSSVVACDPDRAEGPVGALLAKEDLSWLESLEREGLSPALQQAISNGRIRALPTDRLNVYNADLRSHTRPLLMRVVDEATVRASYVSLYETAFKDSVEFVSRWRGYKYLVRWLVDKIASTRVAPNQITVIGSLVSILAAAFFAFERPWLGLVSFIVVLLCDSIDGLLARLTHRVGEFGGALDSVLNFVTLEASVLFIGYHLSNGDLNEPPFWAGVVFMVIYSVERAVCMMFKRAHKTMLYDYTYFEFYFRRFAARRVNIVFLWLVGLVSGYFLEAHYLVAVWAILTFLVHTFRALWITIRHIPPHPALHPPKDIITD